MWKRKVKLGQLISEYINRTVLYDWYYCNVACYVSWARSTVHKSSALNPNQKKWAMKIRKWSFVLSLCSLWSQPWFVCHNLWINEQVETSEPYGCVRKQQEKKGRTRGVQVCLKHIGVCLRCETDLCERRPCLEPLWSGFDCANCYSRKHLPKSVGSVYELLTCQSQLDPCTSRTSAGLWPRTITAIPSQQQRI